MKKKKKPTWKVRMETEKRAIRACRPIIKKLEKEGIFNWYSTYGEDASIVVKECRNLDDLHLRREQLRRVLGKWNDKYYNTYGMGTKVHFQYRSTLYKGFHVDILLCLSVEDAKQFAITLSGGCELQEVTDTSINYRIVCNKG